MAVTISVFGTALEGVGDPAPLYDDPLQTGFIDEGDAMGTTGEAYWDNTTVANYGNGRRYEHEETRFITKVASRHQDTKGRS